MMNATEAAALAARYPNLGRCHRCKCPTEGRRHSDEPFLCGQCYHEVFENAGRRTVREYIANARAAQNARSSVSVIGDGMEERNQDSE